MNGIILPGEKTQAACENCQAFCSATYGYGTIKLQSGVLVDKVMRAVCDQCSAVVEIAHQSAHRIGEAKKRSHVKKNFRLSQPLKDYAELKTLEILGETRGAVEFLIRASLRAARRSQENRDQLVRLLQDLKDPILDIPNDVPESILLPTELDQEVDGFRHRLKGFNQSSLFRSLLVLSEAPLIGQELSALAHGRC